jgi:EAL domain-containing protein (putative c-di-GMP-specific phosphodiesterase class I)
MDSVLDEAITGNGLVTAFQQVVSLPSGEVIGYEALARWPATKSVTPLDIISYAKSTGRLNLLDRACIRAAAQGALRGNSTPGMLLLVNSEPATACADLATDVDVMRAADSFRLAFEITERGLFNNPRALLRKIDVLRSLGIAIALDDIGAHPDSLAMLDVVAPDILKLDIGLVQQQPDRIQARTIAAILTYHERTGAVICAEGIETDEHLEQALTFGATLGQGYKFGAAGELSVRPAAFAWRPREKRTQTSTTPSIFDIAAVGRVVRTVRQPTLIGLVNHMQNLAATAEIPPIVLSAIGREKIGELTRRKFTCIAEKSPLVAVFGLDVPAELGHRVKKVCLDLNDPLSVELSIMVLGPDTAVGLVAREHSPDPFPDESDDFPDESDDRLFDVVFTFDRERAAAVVRSLLDRPWPTISIRVDPKRRKLASCTCGWKAKRRRLWFTALGDVSDHRLKTGHLPLV